MELTRELLVKARETKTVEELIALAKENGLEMSAEQAEELFAKLHQTGELADAELENVSGGGCSPYGDKCPKCGCKKVVIRTIKREDSGTLAQAIFCASCGDFVDWYEAGKSKRVEAAGNCGSKTTRTSWKRH